MCNIHFKNYESHKVQINKKIRSRKLLRLQYKCTKLNHQLQVSNLNINICRPLLKSLSNVYISTSTTCFYKKGYVK